MCGQASACELVDAWVVCALVPACRALSAFSGGFVCRVRVGSDRAGVAAEEKSITFFFPKHRPARRQLLSPRRRGRAGGEVKQAE